MSARFPRKVVNEAILVLDVYASQRFWSPRYHRTRPEICEALDVSGQAWNLSSLAWNRGGEGNLFSAAAEGAQLLREGWRP